MSDQFKFDVVIGNPFRFEQEERMDIDEKP
jgi:hypothetical protein